MTVLFLTTATREALLDLRTHQKKVSESGHEWSAGAENARQIFGALARGEDLPVLDAGEIADREAALRNPPP